MARLSEEQKAIIRQRILDESKNMFMELGYDQTSTSRIAKSVGIAEGTIFNYFDTKADIFLEVLSQDIGLIKGKGPDAYDSSKALSDIIYQFLYKNLEGFIKLPKTILKEIFGAMLTIAKKKYSLIKKLAELDYKVLAELEALISELIDKGIMTPCEPKVCAESVYAVIMFEFMVYIYEDESLKDDMLNKIRQKIEFIIKPYVKS